MKYIAVTPTNGELVHAMRIEDGQEPATIDGRIIRPAACNLRRGVGFVPAVTLGGTRSFADVAADRAHCLRCVRAIALDAAQTDEERTEIDRAYRSGGLTMSRP